MFAKVRRETHHPQTYHVDYAQPVQNRESAIIWDVRDLRERGGRHRKGMCGIEAGALADLEMWS